MSPASCTSSAPAATGHGCTPSSCCRARARSTAALGLHAEALQALDHLQAAHPDFQSHEAHLIYARSLEGLGRTGEALDEYLSLIDYAPGEEVRCRYALLLQRSGDAQKAHDMFAEIIARASRGTRRYAKAEKEWIDIARRSNSD